MAKKKLFLGSFGPKFLPPKISLWALPVLNVKHCWMLSLNAISRKWQTQENVKKAYFGPDLKPLDPNSGCGN